MVYSHHRLSWYIRPVAGMAMAAPHLGELELVNMQKWVWLLSLCSMTVPLPNCLLQSSTYSQHRQPLHVCTMPMGSPLPINGCMDPFLLECPLGEKGTDYELERGVGRTCSPYGADAAMTHTPQCVNATSKQTTMGWENPFHHSIVHPPPPPPPPAGLASKD